MQSILKFLLSQRFLSHWGVVLFLGLGNLTPLLGQPFTRQDSLRGALSPLRSCYDVYYYDLALRVDPDKQFIKGQNSIYFEAKTDFTRLQIDLFANMEIEHIVFEGQNLSFTREGNATFVDFPQSIPKGRRGTFVVYYQGKPRVAVNAPWDGGFSWAKDQKGRPWIGVSCEGLGASVWWPNKDHLSEEPDSMRIACEVPSALRCIANGQLVKEEKLADNFTRFDWRVGYPINNYNVTLNIGHYVQFSDVYVAQDGDSLALDYYVLDYNLEKAKKQFAQTGPMLACYEKYFGKYPFWKDGFGMVETPYLGMEHQGAIAYGNQYKNGYRGYDLSGTGIGLRFDYIIIHEVGHEYWGNSVSCQDHGELWIHESFCTYTESLYVECMYGQEDAFRYVMGLSGNVSNREAIVGPLEVNSEGSGDMYAKGALMLHTLRNVVNDDEKWFALLKGISTDFKFKNTNTKELIAYISQKLGKDYSYFFKQYLYYPQLPVLEYRLIPKGKDKTSLEYRWQADVPDFALPVQVQTQDGKLVWIYPGPQWQKTQLPAGESKLRLKPNAYYFVLKPVNP